MQDVTDVIVIGAGFAGATAARELTRIGRSVRVLDYRVRLGRGLDAVIRRSKETFLLPYRPDTLAPDLLAELDSVSVPEALAADPQLTEERRRLADMMWGLRFNARSVVGAYGQALRWGALAGGNWLLLQEICTRFQIFGGTKRLIESIWGDAKADLHLETTVESVSQGSESVTVTTVDGKQYWASCVLATVPIGGLRQIRFDPELPRATAELAAAGQASAGCKAFVRVAGSRQPYGVVSADPGPLSSVRYLYDDGDSHVLVCFGADANAIDVADHDSVQEAVTRLIPSARVLAWTGHDWTRDPWCGQTWAMLWPGLIDGAIESGIAEARRASERE